MTVYVAVASFDGDTFAPLPDSCVAALRLPGAAVAARHGVGGFACAAARTRVAGDALHVARGIVVAGDVRLDGRADLARALRGTITRPPERQGAGDAATADDDLALVLAAYLTWGATGVGRLRGDFSFVLWDTQRRALLAARDGLGVRPLYYARVPGGLCVSNTIDAVRAHPAVGDALHRPAIVSFLEHGWNRDTATTTFAAIARVPAGAMLRQGADDRDAAIEHHWHMPDPAPLHYRRDEEYVEHYRAILDEAVRDRIGSGTTILLSGGMDSTSIAATACRVAPRANLSALTLRTPEVESPEEARLATAVAGRTGIPHEVREFEVALMAGDFHRTPEPLDDPELPVNRELYTSIAHRTPVVIQGEDGDALFSPPGLAPMLKRASVFDVLRRVAAYTVRHGQHPYMGFWLARRFRSLWKHEETSRPAWLRSNAGESPPEPAPPRSLSRPEAVRHLAGSIWQSVHQGCDRAFLGAAVEFRWPLLDTRLLEFVFAIPPVPWCQRKHLARRAFANELPADVISRPKTTVPRFVEIAVAQWRRRTGAAFAPLRARTAEFVDASSLADTLRNGGADEVLAAWRALLLDRWFRDVEAA